MFQRKRRHSSIRALGVLTLLAVSLAIGCTAPLFRGQSPDVNALLDVEEKKTTLIRDVAVPWGLNYLKVEGIALVTGLDGTGSDPPPSPQRDALIKEMQTHEVYQPHQLLASPNTSLVLVRAFVPPAAEVGDRVDAEVIVPRNSATTSLRGGWLMQSRLREVQLLGSEAHVGHVMANAEGHLLVDAVFDGSDDKNNLLRGRVLGGCGVRLPRRIGIVLRDSHASVEMSTKVAAIINNRFHRFDHGIKRGAATPKDDNFIELSVPPRYRNNLVRYVRVVQSLAVGENANDRVQRLVKLERMLFEPTTASNAALQLEAIGTDGVTILKKGLDAPDAEIRFYAAESLAYLDESAAADSLVEAARDQPAFRWHALAGMSVMDHISAYDGLSKLFDVSSAETRYGAFRSMQERNPREPLIRGEVLKEKFAYHAVPTTGGPMVHFARYRRPEIVVFGQDQMLAPPAFLYAGPNILLKGVDATHIRVTRYVPGKDDVHAVCSPHLDSVVRAIVDVGGGYGEVYDAIHSAKNQGYLQTRVVVDATPKPGREYRRPEAVDDESSAIKAANPTPNLFYRHSEPEAREEDPDDVTQAKEPEPPPKKKGVFARMGNWIWESL